MEKSKLAENIIRNHTIWAMGAGLIPVIVADVFAVTALQLDMIRQLCRTYEVEFHELQGKAIITSLTGSILARLGAESLLKLIPGIGTILGGAAVSAFSGATTYAIGEVFKNHFESGGSLLNFEVEKIRHAFSDLFEKGKSVAHSLKNSPENPEKRDAAIQLRELAELKNAGHLTDDEFEKLKKKIVGG